MTVEHLQQKLFDLAMVLTENGAKEDTVGLQLIELSSVNIEKKVALDTGKKGSSISVERNGDELVMKTVDEAGAYRVGTISWRKDVKMYRLDLHQNVELPHLYMPLELPFVSMK